MSVETPLELSRRLSQTPGTVWAYCRVSSTSQEDGQSFTFQQQAIEAYCEKKGLSRPHFVIETASAKEEMFKVDIEDGEAVAKAGEQRPLLLMLLGHLTQTTGAHLLVWKLDRLARAEGDQEQILSLCWRHDVTVHSTMASEQDVLDGKNLDPARVLFRTILGAVASYERRMIEMRMRSGMMIKAAKGEYTGGNIPFGYMVKDKDLCIDAFKAEMVRFIYYLSFFKMMNQTAIADYLRQNKSPKDRTKYHRILIGRILNKYRNLYQGKYKNRYGDIKERPDLAILPEDLNDLQKQFEKGSGQHVSQ